MSSLNPYLIMNTALENAFGIAPPPHPIAGTVVVPMPDDSASPLDIIGHDSFTLDDCKAEIARAQDEYEHCAGAAIRAGVALGTAALIAKELVPFGQFSDWIKANTSVSHQWVAACMRAAQAWQLGLGNDKMQEALQQANTVEKLANLLRPLQGKAPAVRKLKLDKPQSKASDVTDVTPRPVPAPVDTKAADLKAWEKRLDAREKALDERERLLALREAAAQAPALKVARRMDEGTPAPDMEAARKAAKKRMAPKAPAVLGAKKAVSKPANAATTADQPPGKGVVASAEKTAQTEAF